MRPNESGGQVLENRLEIDLARKALASSGETDFATEIEARVDESGVIIGNLDLSLTQNHRHEIVELDDLEAHKVVNALEKVVNGRLPVSYPFEKMLAATMVDRYHGLPTIADTLRTERASKEKRILPGLSKLILRS